MRLFLIVLSLSAVTACTPLTPSQTAGSSYQDRTTTTGSNIPRRSPSVDADRVDANASNPPSAVIH